MPAASSHTEAGGEVPEAVTLPSNIKASAPLSLWELLFESYTHLTHTVFYLMKRLQIDHEAQKYQEPFTYFKSDGVDTVKGCFH